jgi:thiamine biosynthesis protein ThiS
MQISLNGETRQVTDGSTVADLLRELELEGARVAVERNRRIVATPARGSERLAEGDRLEIVTFVGGG